jgi:PPOX class probable F420-dependent enzyme
MMAASSTSEHPGAAASADNQRTLAAPQFTGKYLSLESFKRDGTGVATPVWFVTDDGKILVITGDGSYKVRRIRRNPAVTVAECTAAGRLRSARVPARAQVLTVSEVPSVRRLMSRKYRVDRIIILPVYRAVQAIAHGRSNHQESVVLMITPGS